MPPAEPNALTKKQSRPALGTLFEAQGLAKQGRASAPTQRCPIWPTVHRNVPETQLCIRHRLISSQLPSVHRNFQVFIDPENKKLDLVTPAGSPDLPSPQLSLRVRIFEPPYSQPIGSVFYGDEWTPLVNSLDHEVIEIIGVCQASAVNLNMDIEDIAWTSLHLNIIGLDALTITDITRNCWMIIYEILRNGYRWKFLLEERNILARVKRNLRQSQPRLRWDVACETMLSLGFRDEWLYD